MNPPASSQVEISAMLAEADELRSRGAVEPAIAAYENAHRANPGRIYPLYWLATLEEARANFKNARSYCVLAMVVDPDDVGLQLRYASICSAMGDDVTALRHLERVAAIDPEIPGIHALVGDELCRLGRVVDGIAAFERALKRTPDDVVLQSNLLFVRNFCDAFAPEVLFEMHRNWGARHEVALAGKRRAAMPRELDASGPIRIGYVSPDFREHAVASFLESLLVAHDTQAFEVHCYDTSALPGDRVTERLRRCAFAWHRVAELDDDTLAAAIRADGIDVLVDLSGHTRGNRLLTFARKPAPVQATWLGYLQTTGLSTVDFRITDAFLDPPGMTEHLHTERLVRLSAHACFAAMPDSPPVQDSPVNSGAGLTYGSVNQWPKVSEGTKDCWARVLIQSPDARLLVIVRGGQHESVQGYVRDIFIARGVQGTRIDVLPFQSAPDFLRTLCRIDIALDPFPYGGGTTTMQCLWMGVPVVTLEGRTALSRNSVGILESVGLTDLIARDPASYVDKAVSLGENRSRLAALRGTLRDRMRTSRVMGAKEFARDIERAYRRMWTEYCARHS